MQEQFIYDDSISYYIKDINTTNQLGASLGYLAAYKSGNQDYFVILDFGVPAYITDTQKYGFLTYDSALVNMDQVYDSARNFAVSFFSNDLDSSSLTLAIGTNNSKIMPGSRFYPNSVLYREDRNPTHATTFNGMLTSLRTYLKNIYGDHISIQAAMDVEQDSTYYENIYNTQLWIYNFTNNSNNFLLYNYGTATGCPTGYPADNFVGVPAPQPCTGLWTQEEVAQMSYAYGQGRLFPEIYLEDAVNAQQWYRIALYENKKHSVDLKVEGSLTQSTACKQRPISCSTVDPKTNNDPISGFFQQKNLISRLSSSDTMKWPSDISWQGEPTVIP